MNRIKTLGTATAVLFVNLFFPLLVRAAGLSCESIFSEHPIYKWAQNIGTGEDLAFSSMHFVENIESTLYKGEFIQAQKVKEILQRIFPKAIFKDSSAATPTGRKKVNIVLADLGERFSGEPLRIDKIVDQGLVLPMPLMKAVNSRRLVLDKAQVRAELGLPTKRKVISLYIRSPDTMADSESRSRASQFTPLLAAIREAFPIDIVIVTFGNQTRNMSYEDSGILNSGVEWKNVGTLTNLKYSKRLFPPGLTVLQNNTFGQMLKIHAAADLAVVVGPINFIEPLQVGTPTLLIEKNFSEARRSDYGNYDKLTLNQIVDLAMPTGLLRRVEFSRNESNYGAVTAMIQELKKTKGTNYNISDTAMPMFLDILQKHLDYQMNRFNISDYRASGLNFSP